ncbi:MAG: hypothetical protein AAGD01_15600 [Acidobacteriota bacterium]
MPTPTPAALTPIAVTFDASDHSFTFNPDTCNVDEPGAYLLSWNLTTVNGGGKDASFNPPHISFTVPQQVQNPFGSPTVSNGGKTVTVPDTYGSTTGVGTFHYTVHIIHNEVPYVSDPMIVNKSPTGGPHKK